MNLILDESKIVEAGVLLERANVLSNILINDYFNQKVEQSNDLWKLAGHYYDNARVVSETILSLTYDAQKLIDNAMKEGVVYVK